MPEVRIDKLTFHELININIKLYYPLKKFNSYEDFISICEKKKLKNGNFFPIPILFGINKSQKTKIQNSKEINITYKKIIIGRIKNFKVFEINKKKYIEKIYGTNNLNHPGVKLFLKKKYFIDGIISLKDNIKKKYSIDKLRRKLKSNKFIAGYHTRNIPHKGHEWIIELGIKKAGAILINPITGNLRNGDFKKNIVNKAFKILIDSKFKNKKNVFFENLTTHARYAGPREALFHALIRKNYGCTHFLVGRDHAGVGNYYGKYESQNLCLKYEKIIGIKIISFKEPFYCKYCKKIINSKCRHSRIKNHKILISGTRIRRKILLNKKVSEKYLDKKISKILTKNSIRGISSN